jgi:hypothetical protein
MLYVIGLITCFAVIGYCKRAINLLHRKYGAANRTGINSGSRWQLDVMAATNN